MILPVFLCLLPPVRHCADRGWAQFSWNFVSETYNWVPNHFAEKYANSMEILLEIQVCCGIVVVESDTKWRKVE